MRREWPYAGAVVLAGAGLAESVGDNPLALVLALAVTLPFALLRTQPAAGALCVAVAGAFATPLPWSGLIALAALAFAAGRRASWITALVLTAALIGLAALHPDQPLVLATPVSLGIGVALRIRSDLRRREESQRAVADTLLEHAARGERARIARELHDVVAHHISMIVVQAEATRLTTPGMPEEGAKRLEAISDTARSALNDMRRLLGVLREDAAVEPTRAPQPGLQQLNELLDEVRGVTVGGARLIVSGAVAPLDPGIELTAYRVAQEALTNARRHAPGAAVDVELHYAPDELRVRVRDNGSGGRGEVNGGHGLNGMAERVAMVGGSLRAGPVQRAGFLVEARIPREES